MIDLALVARRLADLLGGGATLALAWHGSIFVAAPKAVGITSTGETGEGVANDLPSVLHAYREFEAWLAGGAQPEVTPNFHPPHRVIRRRGGRTLDIERV